MQTSITLTSVSYTHLVRFFLKDGFFVPKPQEERVVDMESHGYQEMIERSLLSMGDAGRISRVVEKARAGETVTIASVSYTHLA